MAWIRVASKVIRKIEKEIEEPLTDAEKTMIYKIAEIGPHIDKLLAYQATLSMSDGIRSLFYDMAVAMKMSKVEATILGGDSSTTPPPRPVVKKTLEGLALDTRVLDMGVRLLDNPVPIISKIARYLGQSKVMPDNIFYEASMATTAIATGGTLPEQWRGINLGEVPAKHRLRAIVMLYGTQDIPKQDDWNFLVAGHKISGLLARDTDTNLTMDDVTDSRKVNESLLRIDADKRDLAETFTRELINEARQGQFKVAVGNYVMKHISFPFLDDALVVPYTNIRLQITRHGIRGALIMLDGAVAPFYWSPTYTSVYLYGDIIGWALNVLIAGIWRDACVVREAWRTVRRTVKHKSQGVLKKRKKARRKSLPRTIYHVEWGSNDVERDVIRSRHTVTGFYRRLQPGYKTSHAALKNAEREGRPAPPRGWTYVKTHQRGGGDEIPQEEPITIVCRGLQTVTMLLN